MPPDTSWCAPGGARGYVTTRVIWWWIGKRGSGWRLEIPEGFEFESSVPRWLRWFWSPHDPLYLLSAAIHDRLLETGYRTAFADSQWFEAALSVHAPPARTWLAYTAMRLQRLVIRAVLHTPDGRRI